ncbi:elongation factor G [Rivibacter subsaxonicus]|uniref:Elongation factor G n=1 Tax=Rivibacter subsaxonicus TaxID=457575 RepID=A0A4Q7VYZ5_9BURK|nr:elongation factor G [Rivibacter subsaxonicus]RZU02011.1 translation elongation factor 2 (EF-2/EF-G) [Rivibacter subsaxonicus]
MPSTPLRALPPEALRTLAFIGPAAAGKTTLVEALLHRSGALGAPGSVERGSTVSDFDPLEKKHEHSLNSALVHLHHPLPDGGEVRIHLIDTPGHPDFIGPALTALEAVETAVVVVNAGNGIEPAARRLMQAAATRGLCRMIVVNRIDAQGLDLPLLMEQLRAAFGKECLPLNLPANGGKEVVDCFFAPAARPGHEADFSSVEEAHRALVEQVVEVDAAFVERYLEEGDVDAGELHAPLEQALREGHLIPVCFVSARNGAGLTELLEVFARLMPNPTEGNPPAFLLGEGAAAKPIEVGPDPKAHVLAHVFKLTVDTYVGKLGIFRIHQGTVTRDSQLYIGDGRKPFKVGHLFMLQGKSLVEVPSAGPGELCAVAKVDEIHLDAVLHDAAEDDHIHLKPIELPVPVHGLALLPKRPGDEQRLWEVLSKLTAEDPCLAIEQSAATHETIVRGLGDLHLRLLMERLTELHRFEVDTKPPRIAYRETVTANAEGHHRHKKQTGGAGQFGEVFLRIEPLARGAGFEFVDAVKGGVIPGAFMPAVEKGVRLALAQGAFAGQPVVDVKVIVYDGKHHSVDSKEIAFVTAGRKAFVAAVQEARPIVLEPIVEVEIATPEAHMGDITGDLASRRAQVAGTDALQPGWLTVRAQAPLAELSSYQSRLNAMTGGQGRYTLAFSHYEQAPPSVQQQLVTQFKVHDDE